jgi:hypothetical protein
MAWCVPRCGLLFALVSGLSFAIAASAVAGDKEFAAIQDAYAKRDLLFLAHLPDDQYKKLILPLTQEQVNKVALLAGENLEIDSVLQGVKYNKFNDLLIAPTLNTKVHERWQVNSASINLLRRLSDERRITDSAVLPYLVGALAHPYTEVKRYAYYSLHALTFRDVGAEVFDPAADDAEKERPSLLWWQNWLKANKGKQLIINVMLENKLKQRALDTMHKIFASLSEKYPDDLMTAHMPKNPHFAGMELPGVAYTPRWMAYIAGTGPKVKKLDELPSLWVGTQFLTPGPDTAKKGESWPFGKGKGKAKVVYEDVLHDTDLAFRVLLDTPSPQLEQDMIQLFKKNKN